MEDVTLEDLRKYMARKAMVKVLEEDIRNFTYLSSPAPKEVVSGKSSVRPTTDPTKENAMRLLELHERLIELKEILDEQTLRVEQFSLQIEDELVGAAVRLHFLRGLSWGRTSITIYGTDAYKDTVRMAVVRYMKERQKDDNEETDT